MNPEEKQEALLRYTKAKRVHSMLQHVCLDDKIGKLTSMEELYEKIIFPLHRLFKNDALKAFYKWYK